MATGRFCLTVPAVITSLHSSAMVLLDNYQLHVQTFRIACLDVGEPALSKGKEVNDHKLQNLQSTDHFTASIKYAQISVAKSHTSLFIFNF